jgi:hypothetical protein
LRAFTADLDDYAISLDARCIGHESAQIEHDTGSPVGLGRENRREWTQVHVLATRLKGDYGVRQVDCDARRIIDRKAHRLRGRLVVPQTQLESLTGEWLDLDGLEAP